MTPNVKEDQAEQLRIQFQDEKTKNEVDVLSLPSRKEKYKSLKQELKEAKQEQQTNTRNKRKRRRIKFPIVRILLLLFLLLVSLVITYPNWIERLNL